MLNWCKKGLFVVLVEINKEHQNIKEKTVSKIKNDIILCRLIVLLFLEFNKF